MDAIILRNLNAIPGLNEELSLKLKIFLNKLNPNVHNILICIIGVQVNATSESGKEIKSFGDLRAISMSQINYAINSLNLKNKYRIVDHLIANELIRKQETSSGDFYSVQIPDVIKEEKAEAEEKISEQA